MALALSFLLIVVIIAISWLKSRARPAPIRDQFQANKPLSEPEQVLYWRLSEAMPDCVVLCQVSLSRFLTPGGAPNQRRALFNRIAQKSVDFLVCLRDFTIVAAVELDDGTHQDEKDARRDSLFESASLPLVRVNVKAIPAVDELRALFVK